MNDDPFTLEAANAAIHTLQADLVRCKEECANLRIERDEAIAQREYDNRSISIARHYGYQDTRTKHEFEDSRIRPALVMERAVAVALDAWVDGTEVTIKLCPQEVEQWLAMVIVKDQDTTCFAKEELDDIENPVAEIWLSSSALAALDKTRKEGV